MSNNLYFIQQIHQPCSRTNDAHGKEWCTFLHFCTPELRIKQALNKWIPLDWPSKNKTKALSIAGSHEAGSQEVSLQKESQITRKLRDTNSNGTIVYYNQALKSLQLYSLQRLKRLYNSINGRSWPLKLKNTVN